MGVRAMVSAKVTVGSTKIRDLRLDMILTFGTQYHCLEIS